jgi:hypothetical protein
MPVTSVIHFVLSAYVVVVCAFVAFSFFYGFFYAPLVRFPAIPAARRYAGLHLPRMLLLACLRELGCCLILFALTPLGLFIGSHFRRDGDNERRATILVPGYGMTPMSWFVFIRLLSRRGVSGGFYALRYSSLLGCIPPAAHKLGELVVATLQAEQVSRVDIVAHSQGAAVARWYLEKLGGAAYLGQLVEICGINYGTDSPHWSIGCARTDLIIGSQIFLELNPPPANAPYTAIWSVCDQIAIPQQFSRLHPDPGGAGHDTAASDEVRMDDMGHISPLLSARVARITADRLQTLAG